MDPSHTPEETAARNEPTSPSVDNSNRCCFVSLGEQERDEIATALDQGLLSKDWAPEEFGTTDFYDEAEVSEGVLPLSARSALAELRRGELDAVVVRGLPHDDVKDVARNDEPGGRIAPARGHAFISTVVRRLGFEYSYAKEKDGALVHDIFPTHSGAATQSNESWKVDLSLHTENAFHPLRPDFVVLYCVRTPKAPPATHLSQLRDILPRLTDEEIEILREPRFTIKVVDSFLSGGEESVRLPLSILSGCDRTPTVRWHENIRGTDHSAENAVAAFSAAAKAAAQAVRLQPGDLLAFANETCLHGRDKFDASLDGADRWLLRSYVRRDLTQLQPFVVSSQPRAIRMDLSARAVD
ncbi:MAG TPA: TauD/TfdA family dioxygenase [Solirubrobacterales bacterium]|nr:TauD/TfdA family dioxygenase [Solirubrobacterales bacterium]